MPILDQDVGFYVSERLTDFDDGGGRITGTPMVDGLSNNLFKDQSDLDEVYGRMNLRKAGIAVRTDNTETYLGARVYVAKPPFNSKVSVTLMRTGADRHFDERLDAQRAIESYLTAGSESAYTLMNDQLEGQRVLFCFARVGAASPEVGDAFALDDTVNNAQQFVRITEISSEVREYEDDDGVFYKQVFILGISAPLRRRFVGSDVFRRDANINPQTLLRITQVADAAKYYGISTVTEPVSIGDMTLKADSIYSQLVPSATIETPISDLQAGGNHAALIQCGETMTVADSPINNGTVSFGRAITPGSLTCALGVDDGKGALYNNGAKVGDIDYEAGLISGLANSGTVSLTAKPAIVITQSSHTDSISIEAANRGLVYQRTLRPIPAAGALVIEYMAQGNWYRMVDNGAGELRDDAGSVAQLNRQSGTVLATLAALPDVGTEIIFSWAAPAHYQIAVGTATPTLPLIQHRVIDGVIAPNSLTVTWLAGGVNKTATDDGNGLITGDASGRVVYAAGDLILAPNADAYPDPNSAITINSSDAQKVTESLTPSAVNGHIGSFTLGTTPISAGSISAEWSTHYDATRDSLNAYVDTLTGNVRLSGAYNKTTGAFNKRAVDDGAGLIGQTGTVNYANGAVSLDLTSAISSYAYQNEAWTEDTTVNETFVGTVVFKYFEDATAINSHSEQIAAPALVISLNPTRTDACIPGTVIFEWNGTTYQDFEGKILRNVDPGTNAGIEAGTIDYQTCRVTLTNWAATAGTITLQSLLTTFGNWTTESIHFRTPGSPLRPGSFFVRATTADGDSITGLANTGGEIATAEITGTTNQEVGVVSLAFSTPVDPSSIRYNVTVYSTLPLDADILGIDPVRLPIDGRVAVFKKADVAVIHHTKIEPLGTVAAGDVVTLAETRLTWVNVLDNDGQKVPSDRYTADLDAGTLTFPNPLNLSGYTQPLSAEWRIQDIKLVVDVEISGLISLGGQLTHNFPANETYISSAMILGDMQARVSNIFDQQTWTGEWSDTLIGSDTSAEFNDKAYPIVVTNRGAIGEDWLFEFTNSSAFKCIGRSVGQIGLGNITETFAPINPETSVPYFVIDPLAWGAGWSAGNVLRFKTIAAIEPVWIAKTTQQGADGQGSDYFTLEQIGGANRD